MSGGKLPLTLADTDLTALVREALDAIGPSAQAKQVTFEAHLPNSLPRIVVDAGRIQQVLWNLLTNAIKFTPNGGTVVVSCIATPENVELTVRDSGRGIAPDFLPSVFEPFRQAEDGSMTGLGLGLAIVRRIVEAHGGSVDAVSEGIGRGATFRVRLPVAAMGSRQDVHIGTSNVDATDGFQPL